MEKYIVKKETECGCTIYSIINAETGVRVNYYADEHSAIMFAKRQNEAVQDDERMKQGAWMGFSYRNYGTVKKLKSKTLEEVFAEAKEILDNYDLAACLKVTLHFGVYFAPVPKYAGDCKQMIFTLYDRKEIEERAGIQQIENTINHD